MNELTRASRQLLDSAQVPTPSRASRQRMKTAVLAVVLPASGAAGAGAWAAGVGKSAAGAFSGLFGKVLAGTLAVCVGAGGTYAVKKAVQAARAPVAQRRSSALPSTVTPGERAVDAPNAGAERLPPQGVVGGAVVRGAQPSDSPRPGGMAPSLGARDSALSDASPAPALGDTAPALNARAAPSSTQALGGTAPSLNARATPSSTQALGGTAPSLNARASPHSDASPSASLGGTPALNARAAPHPDTSSTPSLGGATPALNARAAPHPDASPSPSLGGTAPSLSARAAPPSDASPTQALGVAPAQTARAAPPSATGGTAPSLNARASPPSDTSSKQALGGTPALDARAASRLDASPEASPQARKSASGGTGPALPPPPLEEAITDPQLREELTLLRAAMAQRDARDWAALLATVDAYDARFPSGKLALEAAALRVLGLCGLSRTAEARTVARHLAAIAPGSPTARSLASSCAAP